MSRRYARARIRRVIADDGTRTWLRHLTCRCGWDEYASGQRAAARLADYHWMTEHRHGRRVA